LRSDRHSGNNNDGYFDELYLGSTQWSGISKINSTSIFSIYPNPIKDESTLKYSLPKDESVSIYLYNLQGQLIKTFIENERKIKGLHQETINLADNLTSGSYLLVIQTPEHKVCVKIVK